MSLRPSNGVLSVCALLMSATLLTTNGWGQGKFGDLGLPTVDAFGPTVAYTAAFEVEQGGKRGRLAVTAEVSDGYHTYSTTQPDGGPIPTSIELKDSAAKISGPFIPNRDPEIGQDEAWPGIPIEEHGGSVTWTAPIEFSETSDPSTAQLTVAISGLVCGNGSCTPTGDTVVAKFSGTYGAKPKLESLRPENTHATWSASIRPANVKPGEVATLEIKVVTDPTYHVYQFVPNDTAVDFRTLIAAKTKSGLKFGEPTTEAPLQPMLGLDEPVFIYDGPVTWQIPIRVPTTARPGTLPVEFLIGFMTCNDRNCDPRAGLQLSGVVNVSLDKPTTDSSAMTLEEVDFGVVADSPTLASWIDAPGDSLELASDPTSKSSDAEPVQSLTLFYILAGLGGGFILNFMPCVLPVIGLKVMSFMNQAGNSHRRVVTLNLAFVGGILLVMLLLALATVLAKIIWGSAFGWGEQFTVLEFKVVLAALVFAMALSFLGVWEIPIPGFATSSKSGELMDREGHTGAFLKGVLTTVLATPCSGPLLGSVFGVSLVLSPLNVILLYLIVGLGMSVPYLGLCLYPGFIKLLPKPGPWMDTLKQVLAFPLLFTVVFFVASIDDGHRIATLILLIVVWFACWLIGRVPAYAEKTRLRTAWIVGSATIALGAFVSFATFGPINSDLPWVPYNEAKLSQLRSEGKTVMIDFTANWCLNCQINTRVAIERERVAQLIEKNGVVPMLADWTEPSQEIKQKLDSLNSNSIPLMAIYPADPSQEPILLRDLLSESQVLEALKQAGPSQPASRLTSRVD